MTTATTAPASTTTVSAGPEAGRELRVGMVAPQTGAFAAFAVADDWQVKHTENALKDGLVCGDGKLHTVKIIVKDSQSDSNRAAQVGGDLINNDKIDIMVVSGTADTVNPVADQCEALGVPSVSNSTPWQSFYFQRGATADKPFKWTYGHCLGLEQHTANFVSMWNQVTSNKIGRPDVLEQRRRHSMDQREDRHAADRQGRRVYHRDAGYVQPRHRGLHGRDLSVQEGGLRDPVWRHDLPRAQQLLEAVPPARL